MNSRGLDDLGPKSLHRNHAGSHLYGAEYEIWADLGPIGITGKIIEADYKQLLRLVFVDSKNLKRGIPV